MRIERLWAGCDIQRSDVQAIQEDGYSYQVNGSQVNLLDQGDSIRSQVVALFRDANAVPPGRVAQQKADFSVKGSVRRAESVGRPGGLMLGLTVGDSQVDESSPLAKQ